MTGTSQKEFRDVILGVEVQMKPWLPIMAHSVCHNGMICPLERDQQWSMHFTTKMNENFPLGQFETKWKLVENSIAEELACGKILLGNF